MTYTSDEKWCSFNVFPVHRTGGSPTRPDPENRVGDQDTGNPGRPLSSGLQDPLGDLPMAFFIQNVLQLHHRDK